MNKVILKINEIQYFFGWQQSFEEAESKKKEAEEEEGKPDQLTQLVTTFSHKATTEHTGVLAEDPLYMTYAEIMGISPLLIFVLFNEKQIRQGAQKDM